MAKNTYPEVNSLNLTQTKAALALGEINLHCLKPEAQADLLRRLEALRDRLRRLQATALHIERIQSAR